MKALPFVRAAAIALATSTIACAPALAQGDIYSRLMDMRAMDQNRDAMVSKQEFIAMMARVWDNYVTEKKVSKGRMTEVDLNELQKILGRSIGAGS